MKSGYDWAYREFYRWSRIACASFTHGTLKHQTKHFAYAAGWKKFEQLWGLLIRARQLPVMTPLLEAVLSKLSAGDVADVSSDVGTVSVPDSRRRGFLRHASGSQKTQDLQSESRKPSKMFANIGGF